MADVSDEIAAMVRDARREPEPEAEVKRRMWAAIERRLVSGPPAPSSSPPAAAPPPPLQKLALLRAPRAS
jgi:hypothetical protein